MTDSEIARLTQLRHDFHRHPELGYEEVATAQRVSLELSRLGIDHRTHIGGTGVVGYLPGKGGASARCVALRADMDALPISEVAPHPYASQNEGVMHACGHDGHMTMVLGAAADLAANPPENDVLFLFQPAEEGGAGAKRLVDAGALEGSVVGRPVDAVYGLHGWPGLPTGELFTRPGAIMASADSFEITLIGKGAHAAQPHLSVDPVVAAAHLVTALHTLVSREISPLESGVVTVGRVSAGTAHNVIPERAELSGTVRALSDEVRDHLRSRVEAVLHGIAAVFRVHAEIAWLGNPYPVVLNDARLAERAEERFGTHYLSEPSMAGEDFAFYGRVAPSCFFFLGLGNVAGLHDPHFDFPDAALPAGVRFLTTLAREG